jgi:predicted RNA binding protein YcfA (HicA-like mRNA interferase family)
LFFVLFIVNRSLVPRKIRDILKDYYDAEFFVVKGAGKGDHRKLRHEKYSGSIILDGKDGDDCRQYQERDLKKALNQLRSS